ncbi:MAG: hypothetical protein V4439_01590 [Patescibacteria group bacterium]
MDNEVKNKSVQTLAEDMAKVIKTSESGVIKKMILEQEEQEAEKKNSNPESQKNKLFMIMSIILIILSLSALVFLVTFKNSISTVSVAPRPVPIIFTDQNKDLDISGLTKDKITQNVLDEINTSDVKLGGAESIYFSENKNIIGLKRFMTLIKANLDQSKLTFVNDNFLFGFFHKDKDTRSLFILLKTRSLADVFDVMRSWENKMFVDLHGFFGVGVNADTNYLLTKDFEDGFLANKNARILRDKDGNLILAYIFADDTSVVITNSEDTVNEIILRLASSKVKK